MSLYRKYRPQSFADVTGQEPVVTTLQLAVSQDKLAHAYLFAGPRGTGKTSIARILAKHILTKSMEDEALAEQIMKGVEEGSIVDLVEIDAASNRGIDDVRELIEKIQFSPVVAAAKVYIIDEAHMLTREAFNALLKTLEEPPSYAYFILATTELHKIPATIQSRCQRFVFTQITDGDIAARLAFIVEQEAMTADAATLLAIARSSQGGMRDAISLLDQLRSLETITVEDVEARTGSLAVGQVEEIFTALEENDREAIIQSVRRLEEAGHAMDIIIRHLLSRLRQELHALIAAHQDVATISQKIDILLQAVQDVRIAPVPALVLETALLRIIDRHKEECRIQNPELGIPKKTTSKPIEEQSRVLNSQFLIRNSPQTKLETPGSLTLQNILHQWSSIVDRVTPPSAKMSLKNARITGLEGSTLILSFTSAFHRDKVTETNAAIGIEQVIRDTLGSAPMRIKCVLDEEGSSPEPEEEMVDIAEAAAEIF